MCSPPHPSAPGRLAPSSRSPAHPPPQDEKQRCLDNGWEVDDPDELQRWRDQEPINAHSHLAAMLHRPPVDSAVLAVPPLSMAVYPGLLERNCPGSWLRCALGTSR